jgi:hypothetical protein
MIGWFRQRFKSKATINALCFNTADWKYHGEQRAPEPKRIWETSEQDIISLHFFDMPPDLPRCTSVEKHHDFIASKIRSANALLVEWQITDIASCVATRLIIKIPQNTFGMTYLGSFTLPFRDFSFVIKVQCPEHGTTGIREAILLDKRMEKEMPCLDGSGPLYPDWNPDKEEYDELFPDHPISRLRHMLLRIQHSAKLAKNIGALPKFPLLTLH